MKNSTPRMLCVSDLLPYPAVTGGRQRTCALFRALERIGPTDLLLLNSGPDSNNTYQNYLRRYFRLVGWIDREWETSQASLERQVLASCTATKVFRKLLESHKYDLVVGRYLRNLVSISAFDYVRPILDVDDVESEVDLVTTPVPDELSHRSTGADLAFYNNCAALWVTKVADQRFPGLSRAAVLPNIPFGNTAPLAPSLAYSRDVLFLGSLKHPPNYKGLIEFLLHAWPTVIAKVPEAHFRIVGFGSPDGELVRIVEMSNGVEMVGYSDRPSTEFERSALTVVPTFFGGGGSVKLLESLARGRTAVVTPHGVRGYEQCLRSMESLIIAPDWKMFADSVATLLCDPLLRNKLALNGQEVVRQNFTRQKFEEVVKSTINQVLPELSQGLP